MSLTHFAAVKDGLVVGTRSSASRHAGGTGKFGPYTHAVLRTERKTLLDSGAVTESTDVITWHGGAHNAAAGLRAANVGHSYTVAYDYRPVADHYTMTFVAAELVEVFITARKQRLGDRLFEAPTSFPNPDNIPGLNDGWDDRA